MEKQYARKEIEKNVGIPARRIQFYTDSGLIKLDEESPGRGRERKYSSQNLLEFFIIKELAWNRVELSSIKKFLADRPSKYPDAHKTFTFKYIRDRIRKQKNQSQKTLYCVKSDNTGKLFYDKHRYQGNSPSIKN